MRQSLWEYITALGHWGWVVLIDILSGATGAYLNISGTTGFPTWLWLLLLGTGMSIAPFLVFHNLRKERDGLKSKINDFERGRPQLTFGDKTEINVQLKKEEAIEVNSLYLCYQNTGSRPAYQFRMRVGYAPEGNPSQFTLFSENTSANPIYPSDPQQGVIHTFTYKYEVKDGIKTTGAPKGVLIHCALSYNDAPSGGRPYSEEWWYSYRFDGQRFSSLSIPRREELEPYVRLAYSKVDGVS